MCVHVCVCSFRVICVCGYVYSVYACACVSRCVCICGCMCLCVCVRMWKTEIILKCCFSSINCLVILRHCLSLAWGWPIRLGWMAYEHRASACFCLLRTESASTRPHTHLCLWVLETQLRSSRLHRKCFTDEVSPQPTARRFLIVFLHFAWLL